MKRSSIPPVACVWALLGGLAQANPTTAPNRLVPEHSTVRIGAAFSENPSTQEIRSARVFSEPLVPVGRQPEALENRQLAEVLADYTARNEPDDFSTIEKYVAEHGNSPWVPSLVFMLALEQYNTGWYSKALTNFEKAWQLLKPATEPAAKALGDRSAGELAYMYGRLGRMPELAALLDSTQSRPISGSATEKIAGAKEGLWTMRNRPEMAFKCGPYALDRILAHADPLKANNPLVRACPSTTNGCALSQVADLSESLGLNYQMAYRSPGTELLIPAVLHWKVGHYAALLREQNGQYLLEDPTFGNSTWVSRRALESEASGYGLVRSGPLPKGWRQVSATEGSRVFGKGSTTDKDHTCTTECDPKTCTAAASGMPLASVHLMLVSLNLRDRPLGYRPPVGPPVELKLTYNQRDAGQPANFSYSNFGPKWTFNWLAFIVDNPSSPAADVSYYTDSGGSLTFAGFNSTNQTFATEVRSSALLQRTSSTSYTLSLPNGSQIIFAQPDSVGGTSRRVFMTQQIDPAGNTVHISYDASLRVVALTDAIGQVTTFTYGNTNDLLKVTRVTDPFGRFASFSYDSSNRLARITDEINLSSQFTYDSGDFIQAMMTPYGTTSFQKGGTEPQRWLVTTYPNGEQERVEFLESEAIGIAMNDPVNTLPIGMATADNYLVYRNTFFWDRHAYAEAPGDYTKARLYHWLHYSLGICSGILESQREPLENRVWYNYTGQSSSYFQGATAQPIAIGRVLDDGTTQLRTFGYNALGHVTNSVDPLGRTMSYVYASNQVDLLEVRQTTGGNNDLLLKAVYNSQHLPVAIWDAAGQMTTNTYNARGQLLSTTNPKGETTTLTYDTNGYLLTIDGPLPGSADNLTLSYDPVGRVRTLTGPDGYSITNSFDNLDRLTQITYPDGTFVAFGYNRLDRVSSRDRLGRLTQYTYDALRRLVSVQDPLNRIIRLQYCGCGGLEALIDALGRPTQWIHDIQGRVTSKQYADGSSTVLTYEGTTSRLKSIRDEKGQVKSMTYYPDDELMTISYPVAQNLTPPVTFTYDFNYDRLLSMEDGLGTTTYSYVPAGSLGALRIASINGPWTNDSVTYAYDALGRPVNRAINGIVETYAYDPLGRITNIVNALGNFTYGYDGATERVLDTFYPNGRTTHFDYFDNLGDRRLLQISNRRADNSLISRFAYLYNPAGVITNWVQELGAVTNNWAISYDTADQLTGAQINTSTTNVDYAESYDAAGNRTVESVSSAARSFQCNGLNELVFSSDNSITNATYEWDAEQRLTAINQGTNRSEFYYDGVGRRARIVEKQNGNIVADRRFVWCGSELCEERDADGVVQKRCFPMGQQVVSGASAGNYFYTRDHLDSLREMHDAAGVVRARYDYGPYGQQTKLEGDLDCDWGFDGYLVHAPTGLNLAPLRVYDPRTARWVSRDPLGELGGVNLYGFAANNPVNMYDPLGLFCLNLLTRLQNATIGLYAGAGGGATSGAAVGAVAGGVFGAGAGAAPGAAAGLAGGAVSGGISGAIGGFLSPCESGGDVWREQLQGGLLGGAFRYLPGLSKFKFQKLKGFLNGAGSWLAVSEQTFTKFSNKVYSYFTTDLKPLTVIKTFVAQKADEIPETLATQAAGYYQDLVNWATGPTDEPPPPED